MRRQPIISLGLLLVISFFSVPVQARDSHERNFKEQVLHARVYDVDEFRGSADSFPPANVQEGNGLRGEEAEREDGSKDRAKPGYRNETDDSGFVLGGPQDQHMDGVTIQYVIKW